VQQLDPTTDPMMEAPDDGFSPGDPIGPVGNLGKGAVRRFGPPADALCARATPAGTGKNNFGFTDSSVGSLRFEKVLP
jgi:hypothetical protein